MNTLERLVFNALIAACCTPETVDRMRETFKQGGNVRKLNANKTTIELVGLSKNIAALLDIVDAPEPEPSNDYEMPPPQTPCNT